MLKGLLRNLRELRRERADFTAVRRVFASPASLGSAPSLGSLSALSLPANVELTVSHSAATSPGHITASISGGRTIGTRGGAASVKQSLGWLERGRTVTINRASGCPAGTVTVRAHDGAGRSRVIATGTFS